MTSAKDLPSLNAMESFASRLNRENDIFVVVLRCQFKKQFASSLFIVLVHDMSVTSGQEFEPKPPSI